MLDISRRTPQILAIQKFWFHFQTHAQNVCGRGTLHPEIFRSSKVSYPEKNLAYVRQSISRPMRIVARRANALKMLYLSLHWPSVIKLKIPIKIRYYFCHDLFAISAVSGSGPWSVPLRPNQQVHSGHL